MTCEKAQQTTAVHCLAVVHDASGARAAWDGIKELGLVGEMDNDIGQVKIQQISCCTTDGPELAAIYEVEIFQWRPGRICWKSKEFTLWSWQSRNFVMLMMWVGQRQSGLRRSPCALHCLPFQLYLAGGLQDLHTPGTRSSFNQRM